jgi:hypothetical protein
VNTLIFLTVTIGVASYAATLTCGRLFASCFSLLAAASVPVIAFM